MAASVGRGRGRAAGIGALAAVGALAVLSAVAEAVQADLTSQFRRAQQFIQLTRQDGSVVDTTLTTEFWSQTFALRQARRIGTSTMIMGEFNWTDNYYLGRNYRNQTPMLRLNVSHPSFGALAVYQPTRSRSSNSRVPGLEAAGTLPSRAELLLTQRAQFAGYLSLPQLPRLDVSWDRNHRNAYSYVPQQTTIARSARMSHSLGPVSFLGGYSDVARGLGTAQAGAPYQSAWDASGGFSVAPRHDVSLSSQASFSTVQRRIPGTASNRNTNQTASVGGGYRPRQDLSLDLSYAVRHMASRGRQRLTDDGQDGTLALNYRPIPTATLSVAGSRRTNGTEGGNTIANSVIGSARVGGRARRGLFVDAVATHSRTWDRTQDGVGSNSLGAHTRISVRRSLELTGGADLSSSGQQGPSRDRTVLLTSIGVSAHPLRSLGLNASQSGYQTGRPTGIASGRSRSRSLDVSWRPVRSLAVQAGFGEAIARPNNRSSTTNQRYDVRWQPSNALQLSTIYTHSNYAQAGAGSTQLTGNQSLTSRLSAALGHSATLSAGYSLTDPGSVHESRQYDASITNSFGR